MANAYQRNQSISLVQRFWTIDPVTQVAVLANPGHVVFTLLSPDNSEQAFTFGVDGNVTNPSVGIFVCALSPQLPTGTYRYRCDGTGTFDASAEDLFDILPSGVLSPAPPNVAQPGPCSSWINGDDVAANGPDLGVGVDHFLLDDVAYMASSLLYNLSGRQFPGVCSEVARPCTDACSCFAWSPSLGLGPWYWGLAWFGGVGSWAWRNECGEVGAGCGGNSRVPLAGYPVREILEVKIDGVVMPPLDSNSNPNYRLDDRRSLLRMSDPGPPYQERFWPSCQKQDLADTEPGTFSITYTWGADVPPLGRAAAAQLARELWVAQNGGNCNLPTKVTKAVRNGVTYERIVPLASMLRTGQTGLQLVDAFIAEVNPSKMQRRPAVYSPDLTQYARRDGQG